jgi:hypothetical protein
VIKENECSMWYYGIIQSQHCNNDNNDNNDNNYNNYNNDYMMHTSMWFAFFGGYFDVKTCDIWERNMRARSEI